jgi:hypothetical protein
MTAIPDIVTATDHPGLFKAWFDGPSWNGWRIVLKAANGMPLTDGETQFFQAVAGNREPPKRRVRELWCICGRRAGKDSIASVIAAHAAASFNPKVLRRGERALVACIAPDRETGKIVQRYIDSYFDGIPPLAAMKKRTVNSDGLTELTNAVDIAVMSNDYRLARGRPILCAVLDELAYMRSDNSSKPDFELYTALLPGMATIPEAMMIGISSPRGKTGLLYRKWKEYFGINSDDILVIQAPSHTLNPVMDTSLRDRQMQEDRPAALAEWYAEWRDDLVNFIDPAIVDRCVVAGRTELLPVRGIKYVAAVDPSGGSSDSMTLAIVHVEGDRGVLDLVREWTAPFSPEQVTQEICDILKTWGIKSAVGDRYGGEWPRERFRTHGITYELSEVTRSDAYLTLLPHLNTPGRVELLDNRRLISQLCQLERRVARSGRDSVDHPRGAHDDVVNAAALALVGVLTPKQSSGANWCEYMRRRCIEAGINPDVSYINTDFDGVRHSAVGDELGWSFHSTHDWVSLKLPPGPIASDGQVLAGGTLYPATRRVGVEVFADVRVADARELLRRPIYAACNAALCQELGLTEETVQQ